MTAEQQTAGCKNSGFKSAIEECVKNGILKGSFGRMLREIMNLLKAGVDGSIIASSTGLSLEVIRIVASVEGTVGGSKRKQEKGEMMKNYTLVLLLFAITLTGCANRISFEEAMESEFLSQPVDAINEYSEAIKKFDLDQKNQLLVQAFKAENYEVCSLLIDLGANGSIAKYVDSFDGDVPFYVYLVSWWDSSPQDIELVKQIIERYPEELNVVYSADDGFVDISLMGVISERGDVQLIDFALEKGGDPSIVYADERSPFYYLLHGYEGDDKPQLIQRYLDYGIDLSQVTNKGETLLHAFTWYPETADYTNFLSDILASGIDINHVDYWGFTPLHMAVSSDRGLLHNSVALVKFLLENGADKNKSSAEIGTPYDIYLGLEAMRISMTPEEEEKDTQLFNLLKP